MSEKPTVQWWSIGGGHAPDWTPFRRWLEDAGRRWVLTAQAALPGSLLAPGEPVWQVRCHEPLPDAEVAAVTEALRRLGVVSEPQRSRGAVQVYRQLDMGGRFGRDVIQPLVDDPLPGLVLLVAVWSAGAWSGPEVDADAAAQTAERHRRALPAAGALQVVDERPRAGVAQGRTARTA